MVRLQSTTVQILAKTDSDSLHIKVIYSNILNAMLKTMKILLKPEVW